VDSLPHGWREEAPIIHCTISAMPRYRQYSAAPSGAPLMSLARRLPGNAICRVELRYDCWGRKGLATITRAIAVAWKEE
jgi:hypothetical protein